MLDNKSNKKINFMENHTLKFDGKLMKILLLIILETETVFIFTESRILNKRD